MAQYQLDSLDLEMLQEMLDFKDMGPSYIYMLATFWATQLPGLIADGMYEGPDT